MAGRLDKAGWFVQLLLAGLLLACGREPPPAADAGSGHLAPEPPAAVAAGPVRRSLYLAMRDGVRIAVDLYLPEGLEDGRAGGAGVPTLLRQTRYWRGSEMRWPLRAFYHPADERAAFFTRHGYAVVAVDARGSGASFGTRPYPWSQAEVADGGEIAGWISAQPWSNGRVVAEGVSYDGTSAEMLATGSGSGVRAVRAVAPRFALFDAYEDVSFPGGVPLGSFAARWTEANAALDAGRVPALAGLLPRLLVRGPRPASPDRALLARALAEHAGNGDVADLVAQGGFRDDVAAGGVSMAEVSPAGHRDALAAAGLPTYSWSGWFDGGYARAAIRRFNSLPSPGSRLLLGPWSHGGTYSASPTSSGPSAFDAWAELLDFLEPFARGRGLSEIDLRRAPVHYYTMVEDRWKSAPAWPPPAERRAWYLAGNGRLSPDPPPAEAGVDRYRVDPAVGTGDRTRWDTLLGFPVVAYPGRAQRDSRLLTYTSEPLPSEVEVTGHPVVFLHVASTANDGAFFAYLEDVDPDGGVTYVTEGELRAVHRATTGEVGPLGPGVPVHSFLAADARFLVPGEVAELAFDLLPTSYVFRRDHAVRLALAGADADHFAPIALDGPVTWEVHREEPHPSRLVLPVVREGAR